MSTPIRFGTPVFGATSLGGAARPAGSGFAARMPGVGGGILGAVASGVQTIGRQVLQSALSGLPPVVSNLATNAASAVAGQLTGQDAEMMDMVDKCHTYLMMNAIFDAGNTPTPDRV